MNNRMVANHLEQTCNAGNAALFHPRLLAQGFNRTVLVD